MLLRVMSAKVVVEQVEYVTVQHLLSENLNLDTCGLHY